MRKTFRRKKRIDLKKDFKFNEDIRSDEVLVIDEKGAQLGAMPTAEALELANTRGLDLVEVAPNATPPVVRFVDYGKFKYQQEKASQKQKLKTKKTETKNIRFSVRIGEHDKELRKKQVCEFLKEGNRVLVELVLRGREHQHTDLAKDFLGNFGKSVLESAPAVLEQPLLKLGSKISMIFAPKK